MNPHVSVHATLAIFLLLAASGSAWPIWPFFDAYQPEPPPPLFDQPIRSFGPYESKEPYRARDVYENSLDESFLHPMSYLAHFENQLFGQPNNESGAKVSQWHEGLGVNPEELGEYAEGDILYPVSMQRNGVKAENARWPNGIVPYVLSPYFNENQRQLIHEAMADYHRHTCIKFKPYRGEESDYIRITAGNTGCWSSVGRTGGRQDVNLQVPGCVTKKGTVIHELMHAIGFLHEQSRFERDEYVNIQWRNIQPGRESNFEKSQRSITDAYGVGYDYGSVMHYSAKAFSRNGAPTIVPKGNPNQNLGQREGFSVRDIQKIRRMYKCNNRRPNSFFF